MDALTAANLEFARTHPGSSGARQPVHVLYGGAQLFKSDVCRKCGALAERALAEYAPDAATGVRFDDPLFGIEWPFAPAAMSERDRNWPDFNPDGATQ